MMMKLTITYKDQVKCLINGLTPQDKDMLYKEFSVFIPSARFQSKYKLGVWDGKIHYFTLTNQHWVDSRESSLLRRLERGGEIGL